MYNKFYQLWARYSDWYEREHVISNLDIYSSEKKADKNLDKFLNIVKRNHNAKEILETGFDILFFHEGD